MRLRSMEILRVVDEPQTIIVKKMLATISVLNDLRTSLNVGKLFIVNKIHAEDLFCAHEY